MTADRKESKPPVPVLPCPFDGGTQLVVVRTPRFAEFLEVHPGWQDDPDAYEYVVNCTTCQANGPWYKSATNACRYWNMRPLIVTAEPGNVSAAGAGAGDSP